MDKPGTTQPNAAPTAPTTTPATTTPPADPVKSSTLSAVLGLVKPENKDVRPQPTVTTVDVTAKHVDALKSNKTEPAATPPTAADATPPTTPAATTPTTAPAAPTKVTVKKKASIEEIIRQQLDDERKKTEAAGKGTAPAAPAAPVATTPTAPTIDPDADLHPDEREELELASYAEKKDPSKKGLADQFRKYFKAQKEFLEQRAAKASEDGEEYDPTTDPEFKKFAQKNEPKFTPSERKKLNRDFISEQAEQRAAKAAEDRLKPEIEKLEQKTRELEHKPVIDRRVTGYVNELVDGMPEDVVKFYKENGQDLDKTKAEFPLEFDIIMNTVAGAQQLAREFLSVRRGIASFDPAKNNSHAFLRDFVAGQGDIYARMPAAETARGGKQFIHPSLMKDGMERTHWTFDDEDVLEMLRARAARDAKKQIEDEEKRQVARGFVRVKKQAAPNSATPATPAVAKPEVVSSPRTPTASQPGASSPSAPKVASRLSSVLGLA